MLDCVRDGFADQVKNCQNNGKKVLLSIGGVAGSSERIIRSEDDAVRIANNMWNLFGGGANDNDPIRAIRPFGDVVFDGFDIGKALSLPSLTPPPCISIQKSTPSPKPGPFPS